MDRLTIVRTALAEVEERIASACNAAGRARDEVTLVVVTKYHPVSDVDLLVTLGVADIGESREQEASSKSAELRQRWSTDELRLHFIGQLQTNKARRVAAVAQAVHSVDRVRLVTALDQGAGDSASGRTGGRLPVTIQVDLQPLMSATSREERGGAHPADVMALADQVASTQHLALAGLMCVAPLDVEPERAFAVLADLSAEVRSAHPDASWLSAGMSHDLEAAVMYGATHLRVGSAILGPRPTAQ